MREPEEQEADLWSHLGSLKEWTVLVGHCTRCGHKAQLDPRKEHGVHLSTLLVYIRNRLRCAVCGQRGGIRLLVRKLPR